MGHKTSNIYSLALYRKSVLIPNTLIRGKERSVMPSNCEAFRVEFTHIFSFVGKTNKQTKTLKYSIT